jgi:16S rRNA (cytosine1402-N4)-methyltransferase
LHTAVLVEEALTTLAIKADGFYVDATFGRGGHTARILQTLGREGRVLALDRDPQAIAAGQQSFANETRLALHHAAFADLGTLVRAGTAAQPCQGVLFDLGVSSPQLDQPQRGFSFRHDGPLDMRMDPTRGAPVSQWLSHASVDEIKQVIASLSEERFATRIARAIVAARETQPLLHTLQLAELISDAVPSREPGKHPATRTFQALRMFINDELGQLRRGLAAALDVLAPGGRLVVISFHSLEDRLVKHFMREHAEVAPALIRLPMIPASAAPIIKHIGRKQRPSATEVARNPRARSAVLRAAEKLRQ